MNNTIFDPAAMFERPTENIKETIRLWREAVSLGKQLGDAKDKIDAKAEEYRGMILGYLNMCGTDSQRFEGIGMVSRRTTTHVQLRDAEKLSACMYELMKKAEEDGLPLSNGLVLQRRPGKENIERIIEESIDPNLTGDEREEAFNREAERLGVVFVKRTDVSFTK